MNKLFGAIALILVGYFGRMAVEFFFVGNRHPSVSIESSDGTLTQFPLFRNKIIKLQDNEIVIFDNEDPNNILVVDKSPIRLLNRQLNYEEVFYGAQPRRLDTEYEPRTTIYAGVRTETKKFIQGVDVLDSKSNKIDLLRQGWGKYIFACPVRDLPSGTYTVRVYLKNTAKDIKDKSRNFFVEWDFRVNAENPNVEQNSCNERSFTKPVVAK